MTLNFGLLGAGRIGKVHASAVAASSGAKLVAVADAIPDAAEAVAKSYAAEVRDVDAIMKAKDIDAVLITTPTDMHADLIEQAASAGKAIFCEKPIDLSVERVRRCLDGRAGGKGRADDRIQPPLRSELPRGASPDRRRRRSARWKWCRSRHAILAPRLWPTSRARAACFAT